MVKTSAFLLMSILVLPIVFNHAFAATTPPQQDDTYPTDMDFADSISVTIIKNDGNLKINSFSKIGYVKSSGFDFLLESTPSKDKKPYYQFVSKSLMNRNTTPQFDVNIEVTTADGSIIETLKYKKCTVSEYFLYINDSKGKVVEKKQPKMDIRDVTKLECISLTISV